jgi:uncharacterized protein (DUF433 family)
MPRTLPPAFRPTLPVGHLAYFVKYILAPILNFSSSPALLEVQSVGMFDRITFDMQIMGGRACIRGMRISVSVIVRQIAHGASFEEILEGYPDLEREDIQQAIEYAAWLTQEQVVTS